MKQPGIPAGFCIAVEQLAHRVYATLPERHITRGTGRAFVDGVEDPDLKVRLHLGDEKTLSEALIQALELHAVLLAAMPLKTNKGTFRGSRITPHQTRGCKTIQMLELWRARPFQGSRPVWTSGSKCPAAAA